MMYSMIFMVDLVFSSTNSVKYARPAAINKTCVGYNGKTVKLARNY